MTDTRTFRTIAWTKAGIVKQFFGFGHHNRAVAWAAAH